MKDSDNYSSPIWIKKIFEGWFDPCPLNPDPKIDGLKLHWMNQTYVNPPYSNPLPWVLKAIEESKQGKTIALLLRLDCSAKWFLALQNANAHILLINERVKFNGKAPPFSNMIAILESNTDLIPNTQNNQIGESN